MNGTQPSSQSISHCGQSLYIVAFLSRPSAVIIPRAKSAHAPRASARSAALRIVLHAPTPSPDSRPPKASAIGPSTPSTAARISPRIHMHTSCGQAAKTTSVPPLDDDSAVSVRHNDFRRRREAEHDQSHEATRHADRRLRRFVLIVIAKCHAHVTRSSPQGAAIAIHAPWRRPRQPLPLSLPPSSIVAARRRSSARWG